MVSIAQLEERRTVDPNAAGSNPATHPCFAPVAQLDRASDFGSDGYRFKSCRAYLNVLSRVEIL